MRRLALCGAVLIALSSAQANAAGWKTIVSDGLTGTRTAGLIGSAGDDETTGIVLACSGDGDPAAVLTVVGPPSRLYSTRPGDSVSIVLAGESLRGEVTRNDSLRTSVTVDPVSAEDLLGQLAAASAPLSVTLELGNGSLAFVIPSDGMNSAMSDLRSACRL